DKTVSVTYTIRDGYKFSLDKDRLSKHNEESLADAVKAAAKGANAGYSKSVLTGGRADGTPPPEPFDPVERKRLRRVAEELEELVVRQKSPRGIVQVKLIGRSEIDMRIRPGTLRRMDISHTDLASELTTVWNTALSEHNRRQRSIRESMTDPAFKS
ncbi:MAG: hypothetical protein ACRD0P_00915, partial [Stackebrandtia sp.]